MRAIDLSLLPQGAGQPLGSTLHRYLVLDTETSGLASDDRIVEIGVVEIINRRRTGREFHAYINPQCVIDPEAERVHGLTSRFLSDKPTFREVAHALIDFLGTEGQVVAHNADFDIRMMNDEFKRLEHSFRIDQRFEIVDTMKLSRRLFPGQRASLDALCDRLKVNRTERQMHGAIIDARLLSRVFLAMTAGQVQLGYSDALTAGGATSARVDRSRIGPLKVIHATADEEKAHAVLCDSIERVSGGHCVFRSTRPTASLLASTQNGVTTRATLPSTISFAITPASASLSPPERFAEFEFAPAI